MNTITNKIISLKHMRLLLLLSFAAIVCSCSMQHKEVNSFSDLKRINGDLPRTKATVFVHLPASVQTPKGKVVVDGKFVAELPKNSFTKLTLSPGTHTVDIQFPSLMGPSCEEFQFHFQKDMVYHLVLRDGPRNPSIGSLLADELVYRKTHLRPVSAFDGIELSRYHNYVAASKN